jgi:hypothetical protein
MKKRWRARRMKVYFIFALAVLAALILANLLFLSRFV